MAIIVFEGTLAEYIKSCSMDSQGELLADGKSFPS